MKKVIRLLSLMLAIALLPLALIACNETTTDTDDTVDSNSPIEIKEYGETFNYLVMNDIFPYEYFYAEELLYNEMNDSVYERQRNIENNIGITITAKKHTDFLSYAEDFKTSISSGDNTYQLCLTHATHGVATLATSGYLFNFADFESVDLNQKYWNKSLMSSVKYKDKYLLGYGDMCLASVYTVAFNKTLLQKHCGKILGDDTIYSLVEDNRWTFKALSELAATAHEDLNGDNKKDMSDQYGLTGSMWVPACSFLHASNLNISKYNKDEKAYELSINSSSKTQKVIDIVNDLYNAEYSNFSNPHVSGSQHVTMKTGRTLFELYGSYKLVELKGTNIKFGVLPYPLYDENQNDYRSLSWNGYMVVPYNIDNFGMTEMVSDTLELLQYYSKPVTTAFYEKLLGAQVSEAPDDAYMLEIIWDSQVSDFAMAYSSTSTSTHPLDALLYAIPRIVLGIDGTNNFSGFWAIYGNSAKRDIRKVQGLSSK